VPALGERGVLGTVRRAPLQQVVDVVVEQDVELLGHVRA
jgi:hypothetical protein